MAKYKRVLLKLSGEALSAGAKGIINFDFVESIAMQIKRCVDDGVEFVIIVGGGNIWRGREGKQIDRSRSDHMGMLATVINSLAMQTGLENIGLDTRVMSAIQMNEIAEPYIRNKAFSHLKKGRIVIIACGIGNPFFSTDTAAVLRAAELNVDIVLLAKNIDGVYTADPKKDPTAIKLNTIDYKDIIRNELSVIDSTASTFGRENNIPILLFGLDDPVNIYRAVSGEKIGTIVENN